MKRSIFYSSAFFALLFFYSEQCAAQLTKEKNNFTLTGIAKGLKGQWIYFSYKGWSTNRQWDSVLVQDNRFYFTGYLPGQWKGYLTTKKSNRTNTESGLSLPLFLQPGNMSIDLATNNFSDAVLKGSAINDEFIALERKKMPVFKKLMPFDMREDSLNALSDTTTDASKLISLRKTLLKLSDERDSIFSTAVAMDKEFVRTSPSSIVAVSILFDAMSAIKRDELETLYANLSELNKETPWGKMIQTEITKRNHALEGMVAPGFRSVTMTGDTISLSDYKSKYVLLDFWASWCVPCRAALPELKLLYKKYHVKGIEFISVSDDRDISKWKAAIEAEEIGIWKQVTLSAGKSIENDYAVRSLPTVILIDPSGKIIARLDGDDSENKLLDATFAKIFDK